MNFPSTALVMNLDNGWLVQVEATTTWNIDEVVLLERAWFSTTLVGDGDTFNTQLYLSPKENPSADIYLFHRAETNGAVPGAVTTFTQHRVFGFNLVPGTVLNVVCNPGLVSLVYWTFVIKRTAQFEQTAIPRATGCGIIPFLKGECIHGFSD